MIVDFKSHYSKIKRSKMDISNIYLKKRKFWNICILKLVDLEINKGINDEYLMALHGSVVELHVGGADPCVGAVTSSTLLTWLRAGMCRGAGVTCGRFMAEMDIHVVRKVDGIWVGKIVFLIFRICVNNIVFVSNYKNVDCRYIMMSFCCRKITTTIWKSLSFFRNWMNKKYQNKNADTLTVNLTKV